MDLDSFTAYGIYFPCRIGMEEQNLFIKTTALYNYLHELNFT